MVCLPDQSCGQDKDRVWQVHVGHSVSAQTIRNCVLTGHTFFSLRDNVDYFVKGAVPSLNNLPENPKSFHSLGFTQLVGSTQDAQFVRGRQSGSSINLWCST